MEGAGLIDRTRENNFKIIFTTQYFFIWEIHSDAASREVIEKMTLLKIK